MNQNQIIEQLVLPILNPEFSCTTTRFGEKSLHSKVLFSKKHSFLVNGGKEACFVCIGRKLIDFNISKTSVLIFDETNAIVCNQKFEIEIIKEATKQLWADLDLNVHLFFEKGNHRFYYSITKDGILFPISGYGENKLNSITQIPYNEIIRLVGELFKKHSSFCFKKENSTFGITVNEVDYQNEKWKVFEY